MRYQEDHAAFKKWTIRITIGNPLIYLVLSIFTFYSFLTHYSKIFEIDVFLHLAYCYISMIYVFTYHQFIFATSNIKLRFKLLNRNLMFVSKLIICIILHLKMVVKNITNHSAEHISRSFFASSHMFSYAEQPTQKYPENSRAIFVRKIAIMHDKLNDAVEIVNYSFSYEVKFSIPIVSDLNVRD